MAITGLSMTGFHPNNKVRFAGAFIGVAGAQGNIPALLAYVSIPLITKSFLNSQSLVAIQ